MRSPRATLAVAIVFVGAVLVACSSGGGSSSSGDTTGTTTTMTSAPSSPGSSSATVPISVQAGPDGTSYATVQVSVGGGPEVPVLLDTGSGGLMILASAVGSSATSTGASFSQDYGSGTAETDVVQASVTIGSLSTPSPVAVGSIQSQSCPTSQPDCSPDQIDILPQGVQGILGVDPTLHTTSVGGVDLYSPLLQLGGALAQGFTVDLAGTTSGSLVVGPVADGAGAVSLPLSKASPATYPDGQPAYEKYVQLCWTVGSSSSCQPTTLDTGSADATAAVAGAPHEGDAITPGTAVAVAAPSGGPTLWQFTATSQGSTQVGYAEASSADPPSNSGIAFFLGRQVGFDYANGRVLVTPS